MEKKLEQKALVGSARVLRFPDKEFALKRAVFFMRSVYPHFKEKKNRQKAAVNAGVILQKTHKGILITKEYVISEMRFRFRSYN